MGDYWWFGDLIIIITTTTGRWRQSLLLLYGKLCSSNDNESFCKSNQTIQDEHWMMMFILLGYGWSVRNGNNLNQNTSILSGNKNIVKKRKKSQKSVLSFEIIWKITIILFIHRQRQFQFVWSFLWQIIYLFQSKKNSIFSK